MDLQPPLPQARSPLPAGSALFSAALGFAAFFLAAALVRSVVPLPELYPVAAKLEHYRRHVDDYDVLFIGTSRIYRGIIPAEFDARAAEHGLAVRSFNFGAGGMRAFEVDYLLDLLLRRPPPNLRYVFLGPGSYDPRLRSWERHTRRAVVWHTMPLTLAVLHSTWTLDAPLADRLRLSRTHLRFFLQRLGNYGTGPETIRYWLRGPEWGELTPDEAARDAGFKSLESLTDPLTRSRRRRFLKHHGEFLATVRRHRERPPGLWRLAEMSLDSLGRLARSVERAGPTPVLLISPDNGALGGVGRQVLAPDLILLNFDRPRRYPELFAMENRFDKGHLTLEGARLYTRLVADAFAGELAARAE